MVRFPSDTGCKDGVRLLFPQPHAPLSPAQGWGEELFLSCLRVRTFFLPEEFMRPLGAGHLRKGETIQRRKSYAKTK